MIYLNNTIVFPGIKNASLILQLMDLKRTRFISEMVNRIWSFQSLFFEEKTILTWQKCFRFREGKISSLQSETILATMRTIYRRMRKAMRMSQSLFHGSGNAGGKTIQRKSRGYVFPIPKKPSIIRRAGMKRPALVPPGPPEGPPPKKPWANIKPSKIPSKR